MSQPPLGDDPYVSITVQLRQSTVEWLDALLDEFGLRSRGDLVSRLLDEIAKPPQSPAPLTFTAADEERDFRDWMNALNEQRDGEVKISPEQIHDDGLDDFYAEEEEMEDQLGCQPLEPEANENAPVDTATYEEYQDEVELEAPSYREWDDMDNFWNQEGVFEEMSDIYQHDERE